MRSPLSLWIFPRNRISFASPNKSLFRISLKLSGRYELDLSSGRDGVKLSWAASLDLTKPDGDGWPAEQIRDTAQLNWMVITIGDRFHSRKCKFK